MQYFCFMEFGSNQLSEEMQTNRTLLFFKSIGVNCKETVNPDFLASLRTYLNDNMHRFEKQDMEMALDLFKYYNDLEDKTDLK